jgi:hypothetical protein
LHALCVWVCVSRNFQARMLNIMFGVCKYALNYSCSKVRLKYFLGIFNVQSIHSRSVGRGEINSRTFTLVDSM